jgi:hypothetical protein
MQRNPSRRTFCALASSASRPAGSSLPRTAQVLGPEGRQDLVVHTAGRNAAAAATPCSVARFQGRRAGSREPSTRLNQKGPEQAGHVAIPGHASAAKRGGPHFVRPGDGVMPQRPTPAPPEVDVLVLAARRLVGRHQVGGVGQEVVPRLPAQLALGLLGAREEVDSPGGRRVSWGVWGRENCFGRMRAG